MLYHLSKRTILFLGIIFQILFSSSLVYAGNPVTPILPSDNIQDPGDPGTAWGGCGPSDSNCYVTVSSSPITIENTTSLFSTGLSGTGSGSNATEAIFLGTDAGNSATSANNSNFLGQSAGSGATGAEHSNFLGANAGLSASGAYMSNFLGRNTGNGATDAYYSNFIGFLSGYQATNASQSNFIGIDAGREATNASLSNFLGYSAGKSFVGNNVGSNNIIIGTNVSLPNATADSINIGGVLFGTGTYSNIGTNPLTTPVSGGRIGIGVVTPQVTLDVAGDMRLTAAANPTLTFTGATDQEGALIFTNGIRPTLTISGNLGNDIGLSAGLDMNLYFTANTASIINTIEDAFTVKNSAGDYLSIDTVGQIYRFGPSSNISPPAGDNNLIIENENDYIYVANTNSTTKFGINNITPSVSLDVEGDIEYTGEITDVSDERLKQNITDFGNGLSIINAIRVKNYNMIATPDKQETGFIAQNVKEFFPQSVSIVDPVNGYMGVSYVSFIPILAKSIQELDLKITGIENFDQENNSFGERLRGWLANAGNKITRIFTGEICLTDTDGTSECINKNQLGQLKQLLNTTPPPPSGGPIDPPPTDVCPNIEGVQSSIPAGYHLDDTNNCLENITIPPTDNTPPEETTPPTDIPPVDNPPTL